MVTVASSVVVPAPVEETTALVLDLARDCEWRSAVVSMELYPSGPAHVGQRVVERLRFVGLSFTTSAQVVEVSSTSLTCHSDTSRMTMRIRRLVAPHPDGGSVVTQEITADRHGLFRVVGALLTPGYQRAQDADFARLPAALAAPRS